MMMPLPKKTVPDNDPTVEQAIERSWAGRIAWIEKTDGTRQYVTPHERGFTWIRSGKARLGDTVVISSDPLPANAKYHVGENNSLLTRDKN